MKGAFDARGQVLCLDLPDQWLGGVEHEDQGLLVAQQRLDGLQMQLNFCLGVVWSLWSKSSQVDDVDLLREVGGAPACTA